MNIACKNGCKNPRSAVHSNVAQSPENAGGAGEGNRTLVVSLGSWMHPKDYRRLPVKAAPKWREIVLTIQWGCKNGTGSEL